MTIAQHSPIRHLASSLRIDYSTGLVYMLTGYFDESGTHEQATVTTVAGFISTPEGWDLFDEHWVAVLKHFGLSTFHMNECAHFLGEYAQFKHDEDGRRFLLAALSTVIQRTCLFGCAASVIRKDHASLNANNRFGSPYTLASLGCMALARSWIHESKYQPPLNIVFEAGCEYSKELTRELDQTERPLGALNDFDPISFATKGRYLGLQAADFLAYEQCKYFTDCLKLNRAAKPRMPLRMLMSVPHEWKLMDAYALGDLLVTLVVNDLRQAGEIE